jgi:hypothetical protein
MQLKALILCDKQDYRCVEELVDILKKLEIETIIHDDPLIYEDWKRERDLLSADFLIVIVSSVVKLWFNFAIGYIVAKQRPIFFVRPPNNKIPFTYTITSSPDEPMFSIRTSHDHFLNYLHPLLRSFLDGLVSNNFKVELRSFDLKCALDGYDYGDTKLIYSMPKVVTS